ncbi:MAG: ABC transporter substrate-binding protein [Candidatus Nitrosocosmicus sp.]|nr:ABC transporter substrate-binding protein [Candidatus Nitrosocosmicus sp.]
MMKQKFKVPNFSVSRDHYQKRRKSLSMALAMAITALALIAAPISVANAQTVGDSKKTLRIGYYPNITHAQAVIGLNNGDFQKSLGDNVTVEKYLFNAGPEAVESLLADRVDVSYIGPNPATNAYLLTNGEAVRIISGASSGGASFVVRNNSGIETVDDLGGKKFATPQLGNTQDVALRSYLVDNGYNTVDNGGNVTILPISNADILTVFLKGEIDGAWVPEPWATRLVQEAGGKVFVDERDLWPDGKFVTTNIIVRTDYLSENPDVIKKLLEAHVDETLWINNNTAAAAEEFNTQLDKITGQQIDPNILNKAYSKVDLTYDPLKLTLYKSANDAYDLGFIAEGEGRPNLSGIYNTTILSKVLDERGLSPIDGEIGGKAPSSSVTNGTSSGKAIADIVA